MQVCCDAFPAGDFEEAARIVSDAAEREAKAVTAKPPVPPLEGGNGAAAGSGGSSGSSSGGPVPEAPAPPAAKQRFPLGGSAVYSVADVRPLLPALVRVRISRETKWHTRWRASLPDYPAPNSSSRSWGGEIPELLSIRRLVGDVWAIHNREGGPPCPYEEA